jgi:cytosine/adenosine deaminase-related metal-dependent hydrolase
MREAAELARSYAVRLHTHLAETKDEERFCLERFGRRPVGFAEDLGWVGQDVWYAHGVHINASEVERLAATHTGVAHCPSSNMRLASGIAPVRQYIQRSVRVGLGVDGSASNDGSHLLAEARQAMLLDRVAAALDPEPRAMLTGRQALELATRGGASVLGRDDIGALTPGRCADFAAFDTRNLPYAGSLHDPVAALVFCAPQPVDQLYVHGRCIVKDRVLQTAEVPVLVEQHNRIAADLLG